MVGLSPSSPGSSVSYFDLTFKWITVLTWDFANGLFHHYSGKSH